MGLLSPPFEALGWLILIICSPLPACPSRLPPDWFPELSSCHTQFSTFLFYNTNGNMPALHFKTPPIHCSSALSKFSSLAPGWPVFCCLHLYHLPPSAAAAKSLQSCPNLCDPIDGSPPGFPLPGILQARTLDWVAISFSNA